MNLHDIGYNDFFEANFASHNGNNLVPARVSREDRELYTVICEAGELSAEITGRLRHGATSRADFPAVGDWVALALQNHDSRAIIHAVLPRKSCFSRNVAGLRTDEQIVAANVDTVFLVSGLDDNFNVRRIERYLTVAWDSGATPVVVLNKADLHSDPQSCLDEVHDVAFGVPAHLISALQNDGLDVLRQYLKPGETVACLGSSGVGKSTVINRLLGEERFRTMEVREDDSQGRHTTTHRELVALPEGGIVIDTPGMRELQLWSDEDALGRVFEDIEAFAAQCRFRDCKHQAEPGCAVRQAIEDGSLDAGRYQSYLKLQRELKHLARQQGDREAVQELKDWHKKIARLRQDLNEMHKKGLR